MKRVVTGGLAAAFLAALVGCGGASSSAPAPSTEETKKKYEASGMESSNAARMKGGSAPTGSK